MTLFSLRFQRLWLTLQLSRPESSACLSGLAACCPGSTREDAWGTGCQPPRVQGRDQPWQTKTSSPRKLAPLGWKSLAPTWVPTPVDPGPVLRKRPAPATKGEDPPQRYWTESQAHPEGRSAGRRERGDVGGEEGRRGGGGGSRRKEGRQKEPEQLKREAEGREAPLLKAEVPSAEQTVW